MSHAAILLRAARPQTLPAGLVPVIVGTAVAHRVAHADLAIAALALASALFIQIGANYANDVTFPGFSIGSDVDNFVLETTGIVTIPAAGNWTFGVNSDDGFSLEVGSFKMAYPAPRGPGDEFRRAAELP